ncbi:MAG TPA: EAL domain-containing protein [Thermoanaerobaculia bacterium]|nr:EAL domain-containing protein [Thermoanaerobaculia bacterium]
MSARAKLLPAAVTEEVATLIATLHKAGERLERLTSGEVDGVVDASGRTFLLRHAQEGLRLSEASKQAAILDALPANIAVLDSQGVILSVNEGWRTFGSANALQGPRHGVGQSYLAICDSAGGENAVLAHQAASGIRSVLAGAAKTFTMEYPCHSPSTQRWFVLTVAPLADSHPHGVVVLHLDVTAARQTDASLQASEWRFRQMAENIRAVFFLREAVTQRMLYVSPAYEEIWGRSCESLYLDPSSWLASIHPDDRAVAYQANQKAVSAGTFDSEYRIVRPTGVVRWIGSRGFPVRDANGQIVRVAGVAEDITERKEAETRIRRLNRVYAMLSGIHALMVRERDRDELLRGACRIAVEAGAFRMVWIGVVDPETLEARVVAWYGGEEGFVNQIVLTGRGDVPAAELPASRALRQMTPVLCNDIGADPSLAPMGGAFPSRRYKSVGFFPLTGTGQPDAVMALYAGEVGVFDDKENRLLLELCGNISFALGNIAKGEQLAYLAYYDALTGLANRSLFLERVGQYMRSAATERHQLALFLIDLERFESMNDSLGQAAGDLLLRQVAEWMTRSTGDPALVARVGAVHFAIVLPVVKEAGVVARVVESTLEAFLEHPFRLDDAVFRISAKVGVGLFPDDAADADTLLRRAEAALKGAKASGDRYLFYTSEMADTGADKLTLENQLRDALVNEEFVLHFQPVVNLASGTLACAEALIRWNDPRTGLVPPGQFIPILEETGLIHGVGRWALREAVAAYLRWSDAGLPAVRIAVNVSAVQLRSRSFLSELEQAIGIDRRAAAGLELEITESLIMADVKHSIASLQSIRALGVKIAIDDFGTGFSSLNYLAKLPVDTLKIDRSFVTDMTARPEGLSLVSTIIALAHSLKLKVVAEGVETQEQARLLRLLSCDEMQGFLVSPAVPREDFEASWLRKPSMDA